MVRLRDFGVAARVDESAGRVEAHPGKLLRLWARSPVGLTATDDRSFFAVRGAIELFFLYLFTNADSSTFSSASLVESATYIVTPSYPKARINSTTFRYIFSYPDWCYTI